MVIIRVVVCSQYMLDCGYGCEMKESDNFISADALRQYLVENNISCVLGIHVLRAGKLLQGWCPV